MDVNLSEAAEQVTVINNLSQCFVNLILVVRDMMSTLCVHSEFNVIPAGANPDCARRNNELFSGIQLGRRRCKNKATLKADECPYRPRVVHKETRVIFGEKMTLLQPEP